MKRTPKLNVKRKWCYLSARTVALSDGRPIFEVHGCWDTEKEAHRALTTKFQAFDYPPPDGFKPSIEFAVARERADGTLSQQAWLSLSENPDDVLGEQPGLFS